GLLGIWGARAVQQQERSVFTVYDDRHVLQAGLSAGRDLVVLCEPDTFAADPWIQQKVERHRRSAGLNAPLFLSPATLRADTITVTGPTVSAAERWSAPHLRIAFFNAASEWSGPTRAARLDAVVVHDLKYLEGSTLERIAATTDRIVLAGAMSWKARNFARQWCADHNMPCHDVRDQGAFILER
ncbi:MAG TPA: hypothetical protein VKG92_05035, partial [Flavobacteriales bacterium]|nr:hypothetical protein [Flavobacteriales bacterium]